MKLCKICNHEKPYDPNAKRSSKASGFRSKVCWDCYLASGAKRNAALRATPEGRVKANAAVAKFRATPEGRAKCNAAVAAWQKMYPDKNSAAKAAWKKANPAKANANNIKYKTSKLQRIPPWADLEAIKQVYAAATEQGLAVDHIYPLRGKLVSGLHVANNLQLLTQSENSRKGNRLLEEA